LENKVLRCCTPSSYLFMPPTSLLYYRNLSEYVSDGKIRYFIS
jgi:hypothetical protein